MGIFDKIKKFTDGMDKKVENLDEKLKTDNPTDSVNESQTSVIKKPESIVPSERKIKYSYPKNISVVLKINSLYSAFDFTGKRINKISASTRTRTKAYEQQYPLGVFEDKTGVQKWRKIDDAYFIHFNNKQFFKNINKYLEKKGLNIDLKWIVDKSKFYELYKNDSKLIVGDGDTQKTIRTGIKKGGHGSGLTNKRYKNGMFKEEGYYKNGERDGLWTFGYENGKREEKGYYKDGKKDGLWTKWYLNGNIMYKRTYKDGDRDGLWVEWYKGGGTKREIVYKNGVLISAIHCLEESIKKLLIEKGTKITSSDIDAHLKYKNVNEIKEVCEEMYHSGKINRTSNYRYFVLTEKKKKTSTPKSVSVADEIKKFSVLKDQGIITQEEFDIKKKELLGL